MKVPTAEKLARRRAIVLQDMAAKMESEDWHGVADCAMDVREIDAMLSVLAPPHEHEYHYDLGGDKMICQCGSVGAERLRSGM